MKTNRKRTQGKWISPERMTRVAAFGIYSILGTLTCYAQTSKVNTEKTFWVVFDQVEESNLSLAKIPGVDIFVMDQNGNRMKRLTSDHRSHNPSWSPDGLQIVYLRNVRSPASMNTLSERANAYSEYRDFIDIPRDILRMDSSGGNSSILVGERRDVQEVFWLADGKSIGMRICNRASQRVFVDRSSQLLPATFSTELLVEFLKNLQPEPLNKRGWVYPFLMEWVPPVDNFLPTFVASNAFAFEKIDSSSLPGTLRSGANLNASLEIVGLDGKKLPFPINAYDASWSPQGKRIAYSSFSGDQRSILYLAEWVDGKLADERRGLTEQSLDAHGPAWSPDGSKIAFTGLWKDSSQIFIVSNDGRELRQVSHNSKLSCYHVSWSPDSKWIVAECRKNITVMRPLVAELGGMSNIYVFSAERLGAKPRQLTRCTSVEPIPTCGSRNPSFSPANFSDGELIRPDANVVSRCMPSTNCLALPTIQ